MSILGDLIKLYEVWGTWKKGKPTDPEIEILLMAEANSGELYILATDQTGEFLKVGHHGFYTEDPATRAQALEAFEKLWRRGLIRHESGRLFCLTGTGFDLARQLKK